MRRLLATELGRETFRKRHQTIEPVFGQIKYNRRIDRFQRRGRTAVRSEWRLAAMTHNPAEAPPTPNRRRRGLKKAPQATWTAESRTRSHRPSPTSPQLTIYPTATDQSGRPRSWLSLRAALDRERASDQAMMHARSAAFK